MREQDKDSGLVPGTLYMLILKVLALEPMHGYGIGVRLEQISKGFAGGIIGNIAGSFKALEGSMVAMQQNIKAKTLKEIAIAIALLTASVVALSFVDPKKLNSALTAITIAFGQLLGAMYVLGNITKTTGFIKMPVISASLILLTKWAW